MHLNDVAGAYGLAIRGPCFHKLTSFLQCVTAAVGLFGFVAYDMGESSLDDLAWEV